MANILQNQKKSNFLKPYKEQALKDIQISLGIFFLLLDGFLRKT